MITPLRRDEIRAELEKRKPEILKDFDQKISQFFPFGFEVTEYEAHLDKKRWLYHTSEEVFFLEKILASRLEKIAEPSYSSSLYSYRKGRGPLTAAKELSNWSKAYFKETPKKGRGLYVIRADIRSYTDEIPLGEKSEVWKILCRLKIEQTEIKLIQSVLRPQIQKDPSQGSRCRSRGIPTGSSLTPIIANLYLQKLDQEFSRLLEVKEGNGFYARYGDDLVFAHPKLEMIKKVKTHLMAGLKTLGLELNDKKLKHFFWCPSGTAPIHLTDFIATPHVDYLGIRIHATKGLRLSTQKMRKLIHPWILSLINTEKLMTETGELPLGERAQILVQTSNEFWSKTSSPHLPFLSDFYSWVKDPTQIKELEDFTARTLVQIITKTRGTRAYKTLSWNDLIENYGWRSPRYIWLERWR